MVFVFVVDVFVVVVFLLLSFKWCWSFEVLSRPKANWHNYNDVKHLSIDVCGTCYWQVHRSSSQFIWQHSKNVYKPQQIPKENVYFSSCIVCPYKFHKIIRFLNDRKCLIVHWRWLWINSCVRTLDHRWWWWYEWNKERGVENKSTAWNVMKLHCIVSPLYTQKYNTCLWVNNGYRK